MKKFLFCGVTVLLASCGALNTVSSNAPQQSPIAASPSAVLSPSVVPSVASPQPSVSNAETSQSSDGELNANQRKLAKQLYQELRTLESQGRDMDSLRVDNLVAAEKCGRRMRSLLPKARSMEAKASVLPNRNLASQYLGAAAIGIKLCVTCSETTSMDFCREVGENLNEAAKEL